MAQTKTRAPAKRAQKPKRSRSAKKTQSRPKSSSGGGSSNGGSRARTSRAQAALQTVEDSTMEAGQAIGKAASKAKTPLLAGSAALAGAAGGLAIGALRSRHSGAREMLGLKMPKAKQVKLRSGDVARAARGVGTFSQHLGELAAELSNDEGPKRNGRHRSPVEVVLDGLTARR